MLTITVPGFEYFNETTGRFGNTNDTVLQLEHSLISVSKWEQKWEKPFLERKDRSLEEVRDYVRCMTLTKNVDPIVYFGLTEDNLVQVNKYIDRRMTATWFRQDEEQGPDRRVITAEVIYWMMISCGIYKECEKWHLNTLLTLIRVCNEKNKAGAGSAKSNRGIDLRRRSALNEARKQKMHSSG